MINQFFLQAHHVADCDHWKAHRVGFAGGGILTDWPGSAATAAENVGTDHEVAIGIKSQAGTNHAGPPAGLPIGTDAGSMSITGKSVQNENGVGSVGV